MLPTILKLIKIHKKEVISIKQFIDEFEENFFNLIQNKLESCEEKYKDIDQNLPSFIEYKKRSFINPAHLLGPYVTYIGDQKARFEKYKNHIQYKSFNSFLGNLKVKGSNDIYREAGMELDEHREKLNDAMINWAEPLGLIEKLKESLKSQNEGEFV